MFKNILNTLELTTFEQLKWQILFLVLPISVVIHRKKKALKIIRF